MKETWEALWPDEPFSYGFYDEALERLYRQKVRTSRLFQVLSSIAVVVACLGLVGLSSFTVQQRTREIGIRKAIGASQGGIVGLLTGEFLALVIVAGVIASPLTFFGAREWLAGFAYRTQQDFTLYLSGLLLVAVAALAVTSIQVVRASRANPVEALRQE
jgi:putative ABC transport system permease protein